MPPAGPEGGGGLVVLEGVELVDGGAKKGDWECRTCLDTRGRGTPYLNFASRKECNSCGFDKQACCKGYPAGRGEKPEAGEQRRKEGSGDQQKEIEKLRAENRRLKEAAVDDEEDE